MHIRSHLTCLVAGAALALLVAAHLTRDSHAQETRLPKPAPMLKGKIGETFKDSKQDFPQPVKAPEGAPNVVVILRDDVGFGHPSTFGGPIPSLFDRSTRLPDVERVN